MGHSTSMMETATRPSAAERRAKEDCRRKRLSRATYFFLGVGGLWIALCSLGMLGEISDHVLIVTAVIALGATGAAIFITKPKDKVTWSIFLLGGLLFAAAGYERYALHTFGNLTETRSAIPDIINLVGYAMSAVALLAFTRRNQRTVDFDTFIDAGIAALGVMTLTWVFAIEPALQGQAVPLSTRLTLTSYAACSTFLVAIALGFTYSGRIKLKTMSNGLLVGAVVCMALGDLFYVMFEAGIITLPVRVADMPYALSFLFLATAAMHPSVNDVPGDAGPVKQSWLRLSLVAGAFILPLSVIFAPVKLQHNERWAMGGLLASLSILAATKLFRTYWLQRRAQSRFEHQATHDSLTNLPNRAQVMSFLEEKLILAKVGRKELAVLFLDLDKFKHVNDTLGHAVGDELIIQTGKRLRSGIREGDMVARLGGDEFVVVLPEASIHDALEVGDRIQKLVAEPLMIGNSSVTTSATIGVSLYNGDTEPSAAELIEEADTALYEAKETGRGNVTVFDAEMREKIAHQTRVEEALKGAAGRGELRLVYQPVISAATGQAVGAEALLRWFNPELGNIKPEQFISIAEETGQIVPIGRWVLERACREALAWRTHIDPTLKVSVNVSARQLKEPTFVDDVRHILERTGLPGEALEVEVTESLLIATKERAQISIAGLRALGVSVAVDDFGTGYSSLSYLRDFPISRVKIDQTFIKNVVDEKSVDTTLVRSIVAMASGLGMEVVAEGVESQAQAEAVVKLGVDYLQGFHLARPILDLQIRGVLEELTNASAFQVRQSKPSNAVSGK